MSLNLISSLSFLKSKLEKTEEVKMAEVRPKVDMFAGMTESDLDTDSDSDSDSDSSRSSSPGFRTPDTENPPGPTQDILRRCLEMLNNDLTEAERVHRENLAKEKEAQKSKKITRAEEPKKVDDVEKEDDTGKTREAPQGLLKIASPSPGRRSRGSVEGAGSLQIALPESRSPSPGPPLLEPQQSLPSSPSRQPVSQLSTPTKPSLPSSMATSSVVQANSLQTCTTTQSPLQKILLPPIPPGQSQQIVLQPQQAQNILQQAQATLQQNKTISEQPQTSLQPPTLIQNVLQQPQTIVQQPQTLIQQPPIMQTKILQQPQTITQQPQTLLQQPQNMLPQTQTILQQPQTIIQQNQSILQQQHPQGKPGVQVVQQAGLPLQFTSNPIPLLSHTGALLGTIGGVTNHPQLLSSLQQFTLLLQTNQSNQMNFQPNLNNQIQIQPNMALANNQLQFQQVGCNQVQIQPNPVMTNNNNQVQLQATGIAQNNNNNNNQIQVQPGAATSTFQIQTSVGGMQMSNPSTQMQPTFASCQLQTPNLSITGSNQVKIKQEPGCLSAVAKNPSSNNNTSNLLSTSQASSTPQPLVASSTNSLQLVQDPATGLYNLVPSVESSPKRCATPSSAIGSPLKLPKLLLPSLTSSKENTPSPDPNDGKFMCGVCSKYFGNQKNLRVHISEIHEGKRGEFSCDLCNKVFPRKRNMERHKNAVHLKNSPTCYMCHKSVVNLDMHIRRFHRGSAEIKIKVEETAPAT